jgi:hypothetical protein
MQIPTLPTMEPVPETHGRKLFLQPGQYHNCHIRVPDVSERLPAVVVDGKFYSFFKSTSDREKALDILARLFDGGDEAVITQTPKSFVLWVEEPTASL